MLPRLRYVVISINILLYNVNVTKNFILTSNKNTDTGNPALQDIFPNIGIFHFYYSQILRMLFSVIWILPSFNKCPTARLNSFLLMPVSWVMTSGAALSLKGREPS